MWFGGEPAISSKFCCIRVSLTISVPKRHIGLGFEIFVCFYQIRLTDLRNWFTWRDKGEYHLILGLEDSLGYLILVRRKRFIILTSHSLTYCAIAQVRWCIESSPSPSCHEKAQLSRLNHYKVHLTLFNTVILLQKCILPTLHINLIYYELCKWALSHDDFWKLLVDWRDHNITVLMWTHTSYKELSEELWHLQLCCLDQKHSAF